MARRSAYHRMNLDSLLDTVTNVVGFLVIVLAVVQLNVALSPAPADKAAAVAATGPAPGSGPPPDDPGAAKLQKRLDELLLEIKAAEEAVRGAPGAAVLRDKKDDLQRLLDRLESAIERLRKKVQAAQGELADLQKQNAELAKLPPGTPEVENLTSVRIVEAYSKDSRLPKPAWAAKERTNFVCRRGRVYAFDMAGLGRKLNAGISAAMAGTSGGMVGPESFAKLVSYFQSHDVGDKFFRMRLSTIQIGPARTLALTLEPRSDTQGENPAAIRAAASSYAGSLAGQHDPKTHWIRFYVWADSFEVYLAARAQAEARGFDVGWQPFPADFEIKEILGGAPGEDTRGPG